ncbi:MAG: RimK family alpha-L-glutamate ligase [Eubacteriales bacterium]|nr:RimK family alpha-L-glutamate ligase [Eubacteriales bacterium]
MTKSILFVRNAYLDTPPFKFIEEQVVSEAEKHGIAVVSKTNEEFVIPSAFENLPKICVFWDKDVNLAVYLEQSGVRVMNKPEVIALCDDKTKTFLCLRDKVPQPETLLCPQSFKAVGYKHMSFLDDVINYLGLPFVLKEGFGSYGEQVYLVENKSQAERLLKENAGKPLLFQKFIKESAGKDIRVYVVNGKAIGAMERHNTAGDFRSNHKGNNIALDHVLREDEKKIAEAACKVLGADFAGVDLLMSDLGPLVCEVNSNAHFGAFLNTTDISPAEHIIKYVKGLL